MWLAAINYSNNLVYAILYLIASLTFVSAFHTRRNFSGFEVEHFRVHSGFAGDPLRAEIFLRHTSDRPVYGLIFQAAILSRGERRTHPLPLTKQTVLSLRGGEKKAVEVHLPPEPRGRYQIFALIVRSSYPFGLLAARRRLPLAASYHVYPAPVGKAPLPPQRLPGDRGLMAISSHGDDFAGVRTYTPGESLRHVDWKAYARGRPLSVKHYVGDDRTELLLDEALLGRMGLEERLSQLAAWVLLAEREGSPYALRCSGKTLPPALGPEQQKRALELLAVAEI
jgi:uncharacterized protein (DUF58 family)